MSGLPTSILWDGTRVRPSRPSCWPSWSRRRARRRSCRSSRCNDAGRPIGLTSTGSGDGERTHRSIQRRRLGDHHHHHGVGDEDAVRCKLSVLIFTVAIPLALVRPWLAGGLYAVSILLWLVPDRRIERAVSRAAPKVGTARSNAHGPLPLGAKSRCVSRNGALRALSAVSALCPCLRERRYRPLRSPNEMRTRVRLPNWHLNSAAKPSKKHRRSARSSFGRSPSAPC